MIPSDINQVPLTRGFSNLWDEGASFIQAVSTFDVLPNTQPLVPELNYGDAIRFCASEKILKETRERFLPRHQTECSGQRRVPGVEGLQELHRQGPRAEALSVADWGGGVTGVGNPGRSVILL